MNNIVVFANNCQHQELLSLYRLGTLTTTTTTTTTTWHREEEPHNNHETTGKQNKQSNQLSLPHQDDCKTRMDIK